MTVFWEEGIFRELLTEYLLPMFPGTELGSTKHKKKHGSKLVSYDGPCALLVKAKKGSDWAVSLKRSQKYEPHEKMIVQFFAEEMEGSIDPKSNYLHDLMSAIPRRVISRRLMPSLGQKTLQQAILHFESLASQTYEGHPVVVAMGITGSSGYGKLKMDELWSEDFAKVISNGIDSLFVCTQDGKVFNVKYLKQDNAPSFAPYRIRAIASWCKKNYQIALILNRNGEVLIFSNQQLQFARRRGNWIYYPHETIIKRLGVGNADLRTAIYETCLDVSFARTGGCLGLLVLRKENKIGGFVDANDFFGRNNHSSRTRLLEACMKKPFHKLDRRLRQELLGIDGATVLDHTGNVLAAGAIIKVPAGSKGGGRQAAAKRLSKLGHGIKISSDGPIEGFKYGVRTFFL